jgi:hypothetical protein
MLKDACHLSGYPVAFASHDCRVVAVMAALSDPRKCFQISRQTKRIPLTSDQREYKMLSVTTSAQTNGPIT